jgi:hypothetical protein
MGFLVPKHADVITSSHPPDSEVIVEWRALTVVSLDRIAEELRAQLGVDATTFPLVKVCVRALVYAVVAAACLWLVHVLLSQFLFLP